LKDPDSFRTQLNIKFKLPELKFPVLDIATPQNISLAWEPQEVLQSQNDLILGEMG